ncbi:hypothetical protein [Streptomyces sp. ISL-36]|uniref:hypothetical protein n=1 Tax=Streptomyces sp. ISL-36 TaxID=2819182 RepID=UPI0020350B69|nr:hypothetical protein [Streptomyces sp. ISL-36]
MRSSGAFLGRAEGAAVVEDGVAAATGLAPGGLFGDGGDFAGAGVAPVAVAQVDGDALKELFVQAFAAGVDGLAAAVLDEPFQEADDTVGAVVEVLGIVPPVSMSGAASRSRRPLWTPCRC